MIFENTSQEWRSLILMNWSELMMNSVKLEFYLFDILWGVCKLCLCAI